MLNTLEIIFFSFRLIGLRYAFLIFFSISLTLGLLLFAQSVLKGYETSLLTKIIGSTAHISILSKESMNDLEVESIVTQVKDRVQVRFFAKGLAYSGTADIFTTGVKDTDNDMDDKWETIQLQSQSPEIFFKGMVYSTDYADYLAKILIDFKTQSNTNITPVTAIYAQNNLKDWNGYLVYKKPIAFPPSLYREIIDPYINQVNYPNIRFTQTEKFNNKLANKNIEFAVVATLDTPVSDETVPIITAYETFKYLLEDSTEGVNYYNYLEFFLVNLLNLQ